jgi:acyl-coenzyme A synthetase/AMP-(fatty) acid ligase
MIEISLLEIVLLAWAALATAAYFQVKDELRGSKKLIWIILNDEHAREEIVKAHQNWKEQST